METVRVKASLRQPNIARFCSLSRRERVRVRAFRASAKHHMALFPLPEGEG
jgi:hypothetical protein